MLLSMFGAGKIPSETTKKTLERGHLPDFGCLFLSDGLNFNGDWSMSDKQEEKFYPSRLT